MTVRFFCAGNLCAGRNAVWRRVVRETFGEFSIAFGRLVGVAISAADALQYDRANKHLTKNVRSN